MLTRSGNSAVCRVLKASLLAFVTLMAAAPLFAHQTAGDNGRRFRLFLPGVFDQLPAKSPTALTLVNLQRSKSNLPPVSNDPSLHENCIEHARYMPVNNQLTHEQDPQLPFASEAGQNCAQHSNTWIGPGAPQVDWEPDDSIDGWMHSVGHRLWLLYPTTQAFGFGFHETNDHRAAAAIDVLSAADFTDDAGFSGWPVRSPGVNETAVPADRYPITLSWPYFGPSPTIESTRLTNGAGVVIAHEANTNLPAGHKGIQIIPRQTLPVGSELTVEVTGRYDGQPFSFNWQFTTTASTAEDANRSSSSLGALTAP